MRSFKITANQDTKKQTREQKKKIKAGKASAFSDSDLLKLNNFSPVDLSHFYANRKSRKDAAVRYTGQVRRLYKDDGVFGTGESEWPSKGKEENRLVTLERLR